MIVEAVEQAAEKIIAEAEEEARRYVSEAKKRTDEAAAARAREMSTLVERLDERVARLRDEMDGLIEVLGEVRSGLAEVGDSKTGGAPQTGRLREVKPDFDSEEDRDFQLAGSTGLDAARLLATQMAMAGTAREKVQACLEQELPAEEVSPILEAVFGSEE